MITEDAASEVITATRLTQIVTHIKNNNIAYLLGVFMMDIDNARTLRKFWDEPTSPSQRVKRH